MNEESHWKHIVGGDEKCFVCDKVFKKGQVKQLVGFHKITGVNLVRHHYCESGSVNWEKKFGGRFWLNKNKSDQKEEPIIIKRRKKI
jgi:hypothetical protein